MAQIELKRNPRPISTAGDLVVDPLGRVLEYVGVVPEGEEGVGGDREVAWEGRVVVVPGACVEGEKAVG